MKKLRNILSSFLCGLLLFGCQYNISGVNKKHIPSVSEYIPPEARAQYDEPRVSQDIISNPIKIALLVPLSGGYKDLGQGMLNAAQLAMFRIGDPNLTLVPIDTNDSPYVATQAAKKAVAEGVKIILGPVFSNGAKAVAKVAAENNIQVVSFSNDKSLAGSGAFAIGFMPEQQVSRIIKFAISKGIKDFVTLLPSDAYGKIVASESQQIVASQKGISIVKNEIYKTDAQGRALQLDEHVKLVFDAAMRESLTTPRAVLLPASSVITGQMLGILSKYNIDKSQIQFLGNDQWYDPAVLANRVLEGAWFTALPYERRSEFESKFKEVYGYDAPKLSGLAYDGIALAATIARLSHGEGFTRESLINPRGFMGVDGIFRLKENGLAERGFAVMSIRDGRAIVIDAAPTSFSDF